MKRLLYILFFLVSAHAYGQPERPRSSQAITAVDSRLKAALNLIIPDYLDTTSANVPGAMGLDTSGQVIYTYNDQAFWVRAHNPKRWISWNSQSILPNGVYSGGDVYYTGTGLQFGVTAATYVLNNIIYRTQDTILTLDPADPTFDRFDLIVLTSAGAGFITGEPSASPQEPSINPTTTVPRALVSVPAGSLTPGNLTQDIIYDQNLGEPTEWTTGTNGTVDFDDTDFPYHLTKDAEVTGLTTSQYVSFLNDDTVHTASYGALVMFVRLSASIPVNSLAVGLYYQGVAVGQVPGLSLYGLRNAIINGYQSIVVPTIGFGQRDIIFDEIRIRTFANVTATFRIDYMQLQKGYTLFYQQPNGFGSVITNSGTALATQPVDVLTLLAATPLTTNASGKTITINHNNGFILNQNLGSDTTGSQAASMAIRGQALFTGPLVENVSDIKIIGLSGSQANPLFKAVGNTVTITTLQADNLTSRNLSTAPNQTLFNGGGIAETNDPQHQSYTVGGFGFYNVFNSNYGMTLDQLADQNPAFIIQRWRLNGNTVATMNRGGGLYADSVSGYTHNFNALLTDNDWVTKKYADSIAGGGAFVTSVATNTATGITGGPITSSGTIAADTTLLATRLYIQTFGTFYNSNVGAGFRLASPFTNNIRTLSNSYALTWDSTTNANTLTPTIDTTLMATRAWVGAGGGGGGSVSAFSFSNANGFVGNVTNSTTTPQLTLSTSVNGIIKGNGTAMSAAVSGTDYAPATIGTAILKGNGSGGFSAAVAQTDYTSPSVTSLSSLTTASALTTTGTMTSGSISTGYIVRGVTMTLGSDASNDMYYRNASGVLTRLANGTTGQVLSATTGGAPSWSAPSVTAGVSSITGTANQVIASAATGAVTLSLPQSIATTSVVQFGRATLGGTAATSPLTFTSNTDATGAAGRWYYNGTRLAFSPSTTIKRVALTNDVAPANGQIPIGNGTDFTVSAISSTNNTMVITNGSGSITVGLNIAPQTLTSGGTITWNATNGFNAILVLANTGATLNITNPVAGATYVLRITQGTGGSRTITTWPTGTKWPSGTAPTLSTAVGAIDVISFFWDGTSFLGAYDKNYL